MNSLHLDPSRREDYRRARDVLLGARGSETICAERRRVTEDDHNTIIRAVNVTNPPIPDSLLCWLTDTEFAYPLKVGLNTMGRSADNDVVVEDLYVSRRHCAVLMHHDGHCDVQDTASKNGTYVNGRRISGPTVLQPGDVIRICNREYVFQNRDAAPRGPVVLHPTHTIAG